MIKAVFFDIDGTLVTKEAKALDSTIAAIKELQAKGIICGVATGRGPVGLEKHIDHLDLDVFITYNGQYVFIPEEVIYAKPFSKATVVELARLADKDQKELLIGASDELAGSLLMTVGQQAWAKRFKKMIPKKETGSKRAELMKVIGEKRNRFYYQTLAILAKPIYQCVLVSPATETARLQRQFPECKFTRSNPYTVDIISKGGSKLVGIQQVGNYFNFTPEEVMVFGDSWNDLEMLQGVGIGVAMGNAPADVQAVADYVTASNEADGIQLALQHFGLINS